MGIFSKKDKAEKKTKVVAETAALPTEKMPAKKAEVKTKGSSAKKLLAPRVLLRPLISEKSTINVAHSKYTFEVSRQANKVQIKKAVAEAYGVKAVSVNIINKASRARRFGRFSGMAKASKKAVVTLKKGDTIKLYEGI